MKMSHEHDSSIASMSEVKRNGLLSRRKLLASLGIAGVTAVSGALLHYSNQPQIAVANGHDGVPCVPTISALEDFVKGDHTCLIVSDPLRGGFFQWISMGEANGGTVFEADGGGYWHRQYSGSLNVCWFGARPNTDSTAAIQATFDAIKRPSSVYIPAGIYTVSSPINIPAQVINVHGDGQYVTYLVAVASPTLPAIFLGATGDAIVFKDLSLDGNGSTQTAIHFDILTHSTMENLYITGTLLEAIHVNGWNNTFFRCQIVSNEGDGIGSYGTYFYNNNVNVLACEIYYNGGVGVRAGNGMNFNISHSTIEHNRKAGVIAYDIKNLNIVECYFERNAQTGIDYTDLQNPDPVNVKCDIHLLGSGTTSIGIDPDRLVQCIKISGIHFTPLNSEGVDNGGINHTGFVFSNYLDDVIIEGVQIFDTTKTDSLLSIWGNGNTSRIAGDVSIRSNSSAAIQLIGIDMGIAVSGGHLINIQGTATKNLYDPNFLAYTRLAITSGYLMKSQDKYAACPAFEISAGTEWWGHLVDVVTAFPQLKGKIVWFGAWVKAATGNDVKLVSFDGSASHADTLHPTGNHEWVFKSILVPVGSHVTSIMCAFQLLGSNNGMIAFPIMAEIGADLSRFELYDRMTYRAAAAPTVGYWEQGDVVHHVAPAGGSDLGWICVASGNPGVWKSLGKISL